MSTPHDTITTVTDADIARMFAGYEGRIDEVFVMTIHDASEALPSTEPDFLTPDMLGEMDAAEGYPFAPEMWYADRFKQTLYAAGWATVKGPSCLTDAFLVGSETEAIEDDYDLIRMGGA